MLCCVAYGLRTFFYLPFLACDFSRSILDRSDWIFFIVLAVFFAAFAGVFLIGDSDAGIGGTGLGSNKPGLATAFQHMIPCKLIRLIRFYCLSFCLLFLDDL